MGWYYHALLSSSQACSFPENNESEGPKYLASMINCAFKQVLRRPLFLFFYMGKLRNLSQKLI